MRTREHKEHALARPAREANEKPERKGEVVSNFDLSVCLGFAQTP